MLLMSSIEMHGIKELANMTLDLRRVDKEIDVIICDELLKQMRTSGHSKWSALAPATLKTKRRTPRPFDTLKRRMWDSFTNPQHALHDFRSAKDFVISGSLMDDIPYWQMVDDNHIPNRPIEVTPKMAKRIAVAIADDIIRSAS